MSPLGEDPKDIVDGEDNVCDGKDDDCDGAVDSCPCTTEDGAWIALLSGDLKSAVSEVCDGKDDDCDCAVDEGFTCVNACGDTCTEAFDKEEE